jgi:alpha-ribazole phosphatase/probable phosphoglycerate mutase
MTETIIDLIRHGEPVGGRKYRGQLDDPLSDKGWQQMRAAVGEHRPWDIILSSPLLRCREFATELAQRHGIPLEEDARWREIGFGCWEGKTAQELMQTQKNILTLFWQDPINHRPQGAEPLADFQQRIVSAWQDLLSTHAGKHVLLVCHAGTIRMSMQHILDMPLGHVFRINVANASITRFKVEQHENDHFPRLIFHGGQL